MTGSCPFSSKQGYSTAGSRKEYLKFHDLHEYEVPTTLEADMDTNKPLYYWQIHSITGQEPLFQICSDFYDLLYEDETAPWFKDIFVQAAPKNHHIMAQAAFWIDTMGGGRLYHGGSGRLNFHHMHNAGPIMNAKGAKQWMSYMKESLRLNARDLQDDPRVLPCILDFLKTKMQTYAKVHGWKFDDSDFALADILGKDVEAS